MPPEHSFAKRLLLSILRIGVLLVLMAGLFLVAIFLAALVLDSLQIEGGSGGRIVRTSAYSLITAAPAIFAAAWILFFGSALGSFMNVVVYRMPLGKSVTTRASHCPRCKTPILARDTIPVVGWILLNGKCRACHLPISSRYPIVEAVSGLIVFGLMVAALLLPVPNLPDGFGAELLRFGFGAEFLTSDVLWRFLLHSIVLLTILCSGLIQWDRNPIPVKLVLFAFVVVGVATIVVPSLVPVAAWPYGHRLDEAGHPGSLAVIVQVLFSGITGLIAGAIVGARLKSNLDSGFSLSLDCAFGLGLLGPVLGWQYTLAVAVVMAILLAVWRVMIRRPKDPRSARLFLLLGVAFLCSLFWGSSQQIAGWMPGSTTPLWQIPLWALPLTLPMLASLVERPARPKSELVPPMSFVDELTVVDDEAPTVNEIG